MRNTLITFILIAFVLNQTQAQIKIELKPISKKYSSYIKLKKIKYYSPPLIPFVQSGIWNTGLFAFFIEVIIESAQKNGPFLRVTSKKVNLYNTSVSSNTNAELFKEIVTIPKGKLKTKELIKLPKDFNFKDYSVVMVKIIEDKNDTITSDLKSFYNENGYYFALNNLQKDLIIIPFNPTKMVNPNYSEFLTAQKDNNKVLTKPVKLTSYYIDAQAYMKLFENFNLKEIPSVIDSFNIDFKGVIDSYAPEVFHRIIITHHSKEYDLKIPFMVKSEWNYVPTPWIKNQYDEDNTYQYNAFINTINEYLPEGEKLPKHETGMSANHQAFSSYPYNELVKRFNNVKKEEEDLAKEAQAQKQKDAQEYKKLCAKYGKKYVDAAKKGDIIIGMHEDLAYFAMSRAWSITSKNIGDTFKIFHLKSKVLSSNRLKVTIKNKKVTRFSSY